MQNNVTKNRIVAAAVATVAIGGVVIALAADPKGPADTNQGAKGKADMVSDPAGQFRRAFKSAATATERRDLVMKACEDRVINSRMSLEDLKELFADSPTFLTVHPLDGKTGKQSVFLQFKPPEPAAKLAVQESHDHDWYMWFKFEEGKLSLYYLTNYGK